MKPEISVLFGAKACGMAVPVVKNVTSFTLSAYLLLCGYITYEQ
jgi:hypothetical protein